MIRIYFNIFTAFHVLFGSNIFFRCLAWRLGWPLDIRFVSDFRFYSFCLVMSYGSHNLANSCAFSRALLILCGFFHRLGSSSSRPPRISCKTQKLYDRKSISISFTLRHAKFRIYLCKVRWKLRLILNHMTKAILHAEFDPEIWQSFWHSSPYIATLQIDQLLIRGPFFL